MKIIPILCLALFASCAASAQQQAAPEPAGPATPAASSEFANLPVQKIGADDLIGVTVYDSPELSRTIRVSSEGYIRMPMVQQSILAAGLFPEELEKAIAAALVQDHVLVAPVVSVSIAEYQSHPVMVVGAVKTPIVFQSAGNVTLLDAITRAGGVADNAGTEVLITHRPVNLTDKSVAVTQRIQIQSLLDPESTTADMELQGGDIVRVPLAPQVYVVGNVIRPGPMNMNDIAGSSVLKAVVLSGGTAPYAGHTAFIYRRESGQKDRIEIPIQLNKIMKLKSPDVQLVAGDILYVPDATGRRISAKALEMSLGVGLAATSLTLELTR